jgi:hypothetical protein
MAGIALAARKLTGIPVCPVSIGAIAGGPIVPVVAGWSGTTGARSGSAVGGVGSRVARGPGQSRGVLGFRHAVSAAAADAKAGFSRIVDNRARAQVSRAAPTRLTQ